jgi:RNA polymerase sigma factor (sigma-70 family)
VAIEREVHPVVRTWRGVTLTERKPRMDEATDAEILAASVAEPELFSLVFDRHVGSIHGYLLRRVGSALAEELTAETFAVAFANRARFVPLHESGGPWLSGIATNLIGGARRAERRRLVAYERASIVTATLGDEFERADARIDAQGLAGALVQALMRLQTRDRDALLLFAWQNLTYEEVGEALGIPPGTVASRINRARRLVRESLHRVVADETGAM